ncbi:sensory transduction histidine kinase [Methanosarcina sp. MTP4]|uniref:PAS domain S-box protein n=1 Tax=Methanosarcina sp. MTP4 TaxID=1434100 RepID=UPI0006160361|nr:PAS domain S-box protein [Methanosarcina sp. MTP4]AKB24409.1 sensory transduction histidine kinase [Methanosarcina sp. MTP4]
MEHFPSKNPNPVLRIGTNGKVLYANRAAGPLLKSWGIREGEKAPELIENAVLRALSLRKCEELELETETRTYLVTLNPFPEEACVNVYGYDISSRKEIEKKLHIREKQHLVLEKFGKMTLTCTSLQALMDESTGLVASTLEIESCKILELLPDGNFLFRAGFGPRRELAGELIVGRGKDSLAGYTLLSRRPVSVKDMKEETRFKKTASVADQGLVSGISVIIGEAKRPFGVIEAFSTKRREFSEEDQYFLSSVAFLIAETTERRKAEEKLRLHQKLLEKQVEERTRELTKTNKTLVMEIVRREQVEQTLRSNMELLEKLLGTMPNPIYYKNREGAYRDCNENFSTRIAGLPKEELLGSTPPEVAQKLLPERILKAPEQSKEKLFEQVLEIHRKDLELLRDGGSRVFEDELLCADGVKRNFLINKSTFGSGNGEVYGLLCMMQDISELKQAEKKLRDNLYFLEKLLDAIPTPVFYKDRENKYRLCNEEFIREIAGIPKEQIIGYSLHKFIKELPEDLILLHEKYDRTLMRERKTQRYEAQLKCATKGFRDFLINKAPYIEKDGEPGGIVGVMFDATENRQARETLERREERYRLAAEQTGQIVFDYDFKTGSVDWAGAVTEDTAHIIELQKFDMNRWCEKIHPEDRGRVRSAFEKSLKTGEKFHEVYRFRKKEGGYIYMEESGILLKDEEGRIRRMLGAKKDITERKMAVEKLHKSEESFHSFMQNFRGLGFQLDSDFTPVFVHGAAEEITGYSKEDFLSGSIGWTRLVKEEELPLILEKRKKLKEDPELFTELEYRIRRKGGELRWVREVIQNVPEGPDKSIHFQGSIHDITERKEAEEALEKAEKVRKKEIHHRIKNNLQVISSLLSLQSEKFGDAQVLEAFRESQNRVISMAIIHEELYKGDKIDTLDFAAYLRKLTADLLSSYRVGKDDISLELDLEKIYLGMDTAIPLGIIVNELVSNALKHAFLTGKKGKIRINLCGKENFAGNPEDYGTGSGCGEEQDFQAEKELPFTLIVADNGPGIPEEIDFRDTDSLGLQLVNLLVEQIEGNIELDNGTGTEFRIYFTDN